MTSDAYTRDPLMVWEKRERNAQMRAALRIAKLPEGKWPEKVKLEQTQWQEEIWVFLNTIQRMRREERGQ